MNTTNVYDNLYNTMKNSFTVVNDNQEYTLGEFMLMKAGKKKESAATATNLPAVRHKNAAVAPISVFFRYINDKLTVKNPPAKDKTIRSFPLRTAMASLLSAVLVCTIFFSYGIATMKSLQGTAPVANEITETKEETEEIERNYTVE